VWKGARLCLKGLMLRALRGMAGAWLVKSAWQETPRLATLAVVLCAAYEGISGEGYNAEVYYGGMEEMRRGGGQNRRAEV